MKKSTYKKINLRKLIKEEIEEQEDGVVMTDDPNQAEKLAKKGINVNLTSENINFSDEDLLAIGNEVSLVLTKALEQAGDEVVDTSVDPKTNNIFDIKVTFSGDLIQNYTFFVDEDTVFFKEKTVDVELVDFDLTPGGKVYINTSLLLDKLSELIKREILSEKTNFYLMIKEQDETQDREEIKVGNYQTHYYDMCPGATTLYRDIEDKVEDMDLATRTAKLQDVLFFIEKHVQEEGYDPDPYYAQVAKIIADQIMSMAEMMGMKDEHDYIQSHVEDIEQAVGIENIDENISKTALKESVSTIFNMFKESVNNTLNEDYDLGHIDDEVDMLKQEAYEMAIYAGKLYKMLHTLEPYGSEVDFPHWWQGKIIKARDYLGKAVHYLEFELEQPSIDRQMDNHKSEYLQEIDQQSGLYVIGSTSVDDSKISEVLDDLGLYAEWNSKEGYWFLPEEEEMFDELEKILDKEFQARNINVRIEGVFNEGIHEQKATCCGRCGRVHVKGTGCKKPYLSKSSSRHCQNK